MMTLYFAPRSPYVRKVRVVAMECGLAERISLRLTSSPRDDDTLRSINPVCQVPALVLEDGAGLFDSTVICEYLSTLVDVPNLLPVTGPGRWRALRQQAVGDSMMDWATHLWKEFLRPESCRSADFIARANRAVSSAVSSLNESPEALEDISVGTISVACAMGYLDFRFPEWGWRRDAPMLASWLEETSIKSSFVATAPYDERT